MASNHVFRAAVNLKFCFRSGVLAFLLVFCGHDVSAEPVNLNLVADYLSNQRGGTSAANPVNLQMASFSD
jgi:hypothetical protein